MFLCSVKVVTSAPRHLWARFINQVRENIFSFFVDFRCRTKRLLKLSGMSQGHVQLLWLEVAEFVNEPLSTCPPFCSPSCDRTCKRKCQARCPCQNGGICKGIGVCDCPPGWTVSFQVKTCTFSDIYEGCLNLKRHKGPLAVYSSEGLPGVEVKCSLWL